MNISCLRSLAISFVLSLGLIASDYASAFEPEGDLTELFQLEQLPRLRPGVQCRMFSSYDRTGGNNDGFGGTYSKLREENGNSVIAEMEGPGCIRRIWFTHSEMKHPGLLNRKQEHIRIYLDGNDKPAIDIPLEDLLSGKLPRFPSPLVGEGIGGFYCYLPIPYREGCKVVVEGTGVRFYQITYDSFPNAKGVKSFQMQLTSEEQKSLDQAVQRWSNPADQLKSLSSSTVSKEIELPAAKDESTSYRLPSGPAMIRAIYFEGTQDDLLNASQATIRFYWDGANSPAVDLPIEYLFAQSQDATAYQSLLTGSTENGWYNFMPMPYRAEARIEILSSTPIQGKIKVVTQPLDQWADDLAYFHAEYREELPTTNNWSYHWLRRQGQGHFLGVYLNTDGGEGYHDLPFWLEGDERFTVDGELTIHGTGSEDYFNCGWYACEGRLNKPSGLSSHGFPIYHQGEPVTRAAAYRWHVADPVPYEKDIAIEIEHGPQNDKEANYRSAVFYYEDLAEKHSDTKPDLETISLDSLLQEMTSRDSLARFPTPAYTCRQSSSYDRDAVSPQKTETWFANWDRSQFIRTEENNGQKEYVMLDADGPGAVVRIWGTWHGPGGGEFSNGTLRVYLDHQQEPVIEGPIRDLISGGKLVGPPLSRFVSDSCPVGNRAHNLYLPIPYAKHCKITYSTDVLVDRGAKKGEALYYQINYRTYEDDVQVKSFTMEQLANANLTIDNVNQQLAIGRRDSNPDWQVIETSGEVAAGESSESIQLKGSGAIRSLQCRLEADDLEQALRSTILEISFDGKRTVWCPIGDFCGTGYKISPHKTWYTNVDKTGNMECAWVMPYEREADLKLHNLGTQTVRIVESKIHTSPWQWDDRSMHFHATWRQLTEVSTRGEKSMTGNGASDVNYVTIQGKGVYVGDTLTLCNGANKWWGEGDEKIYVDGETFPSHFGTGTEDYYGYAWCRPEFFSAPFHAQPDGGGNMAGGFSVNSRYRSLDAIPFSDSLQFDMELWHWADTKINYAPTTFWYARPGATCNVQPDPKTASQPVARVKSDIVPVFRVPGAIEGEALKIIKRTGGATQNQNAAFGWSGESQLWWIDAELGDQLILEFPVKKQGRYKVSANLTKAVDYGIVKMTINDGPSKKFDRFYESVQHDLVELGSFDLKQGTNQLTIEIAGSNPEAVPRQMFGLDYLKLE